jgi:hypothetical protein
VLIQQNSQKEKTSREDFKIATGFAVKLVQRLALLKSLSAHARTRYPGRATSNGSNKRNTSNSNKRDSYLAVCEIYI